MLIPILTYHSVDDSGSVISVSKEKFREHMAQLRELKCNVVSLADVSNWIQQTKSLPENSVAITFDDGFRNFHDSAYSVLQEFGFPATVFLVTGRCGQKNDWSGQMAGIPILDLMDWKQIRELSDQGVVFGAHTETHPDFSRSATVSVAAEIENSKKAIQDHTGRDVAVFAYPYGVRTPASDRIVREKFAGAVSVNLDFVDRNSDRHFLPRLDMYYFAGNRLLQDLGSMKLRLYVALRRMLRALKQKPY